MIDFTKIKELTRAANIVRNNINLMQGATVTFDKDGAPEWYNPLYGTKMSCAVFEAGNQSLLLLMEEAEPALFNDCQERHDKGLELPPQLKKMIGRLYAVQRSIAQCGHYCLYENGHQEHPSFMFPGPSTNPVINQICQWLEYFDYYFPGCLSDNSGCSNVPGAETGQNSASTPNPGNNTGGDVNAPKTAPESDLPEWLPERLKKKKDFEEAFKEAIRFGLVTMDGIWLGTLQELAGWLTNFIESINDKYSWIEADSIFQHKDKHGITRPVTNNDLTRAFCNLNSKSKPK